MGLTLKTSELACLVAPHRRLLVGLVIVALVLVLVEGTGLGFVLVLLGAGGSLGGIFDDYPAVARWLRGVHNLPVQERIALAAGILLTTALVRGALQYGYHLLTVRLRQRVEAPLQQQVFRRFHALPWTQIQRQRQGGLLLLLNQYPRQIGDLVLKVGRTLASVVVLCGYSLAALLVSWQLTLLSVFLLVVVAGFLRPFLAGRLRGASRLYRERQQRTASLGQEHLAGLRTIRLFGREAWSLEQFARQVEIGQQHEAHAERWGGLIRPLFNLLNVAVIAVVLLAAMAFLEGSSQVVMAHLALFLVVAFRLTGPIGELAELQGRLAEADPVLSAVREFLAAPPGAVPGGGRDFPGLRSAVTFENVGFAYGPGEPPVIRGLSLVLEKGRMTALVGRSGAGKSTVAGLLARLHDPATGNIRADGVDVREYDPVGWRQGLAVVGQDVFLFHASVEENLRFARPGATRAELEQACRHAQAHEFITALPEGYGTILQDRGMRLSGGQRQRLALARALLVEAEFLILDEATSELDAPTELLVHEALARERRGRTTLIIAHRLSTVRDADRICVLEHGRLVEQGSHEELMAAGGHYARMVEGGGRRTDAQMA